MQFQNLFIINGSQLAKMKKSIPDILTCPCHKIDRDEAFGLKVVNILEK